MMYLPIPRNAASDRLSALRRACPADPLLHLLPDIAPQPPGSVPDPLGHLRRARRQLERRRDIALGTAVQA